MIYGYARVSTDGQSVAAQVAGLRAAGAGKVFREVASGARTDRAQLRKAIAALQAGDVLMVTRLDRLARSTRDLLNTLAAITASKAGFAWRLADIARSYNVSGAAIYRREACSSGLVRSPTRQAILQAIDCACLAYTAQAVPTERYETAVLASGGGEFGRHQHVSSQRLAERFDAGDLVDRGSDHREIEAVRGANVAIQHFTQM
jgi:hypothetical protein